MSVTVTWSPFKSAVVSHVAENGAGSPAPRIVSSAAFVYSPDAVDADELN